MRAMNAITTPRTARSVCPHDCPSTCALDVEVIDARTIGRVRGAKDDPYTAGVICEKVARYAERIHHPNRLTHPLRRVGKKGSGEWQRISWDEAFDEIVARWLAIEAADGPEAIWPYFYAGTMGHVHRDGIERLRHARGYSLQYDTICTGTAWPGFIAGTGVLAGPNPESMAESDCVVIWGTNAVATQVNVMTHAVRARKERGARIVAIDIYRNATMEQADMALVVRPGTDGALAVAVMHVLLRDGLADRDYMAKYTDFSPEFEAHLATRTPQWAAAITGLDVTEIEAFAHLVGTTPKTYFRLGYGFTRQRNGSTSMHAALSVAAMTGSWQHQGGGAFHSNSGSWKLDKSMITGADMGPGGRELDMCEIGKVLTGDEKALNGGGPVKALFIQNTNPVNVSPEQGLTRAGFARDDLFTVVHEQFMTDTAKLADIVLPATMFVEHDDIYRGGGQSHILLGPKLVEAPPLVRTNLFVIEELAKRLGVADRPGFGKTEREHIERMLYISGKPDFDTLIEDKWLDCQPAFEDAHYLNGFGHPDGKFRFKPDWENTPAPNKPPAKLGSLGPVKSLPVYPDQVDLIETADAEHPFRLATSPARNFLNSTFAETKTSRDKEGRPEVMVNPSDALGLGLADGDIVRLGNTRGDLRIHAKITDAVKPGVLVAEGLWPNKSHLDGEGINVLTGADPAAPHGGAAFHDNKVWMRKA